MKKNYITMKQFFSIISLIVAMLCLGTTEMKADGDYSAHFYLIGDMTGGNWNSDQTAYAISNSYKSETGKYYIEVSVTPGKDYYFALYNGANQYGPEVNGVAPNTIGDYNTNSWKYTPLSSKIWVCVDETSDKKNNNGYYPWVWVEEKCATNVKYIDANGDEQICPEASIVESSSEHLEWSAGWYVVQGTNVTLDKAVDCIGDVHLILSDGAKLTINSAAYQTAIWADDNSTIQIYGQSNNVGTLIANGGATCAGIGGNAKAITINGGTIQATGGSGSAGIGSSTNYPAGDITINGGNITATGGYNGAGIGGAVFACGSITINGGNIAAYGSGGAAGIGSGYVTQCGEININGGNILAVGGECNGLGKGLNGKCTSLKVSTDEMIYAGSKENPTTWIKNDGSDLQDIIVGRYVKIEKLQTVVEGENTIGNLPHATSVSRIFIPTKTAVYKFTSSFSNTEGISVITVNETANVDNNGYFVMNCTAGTYYTITMTNDAGSSSSTETTWDITDLVLNIEEITIPAITLGTTNVTIAIPNGAAQFVFTPRMDGDYNFAFTYPDKSYYQDKKPFVHVATNPYYDTSHSEDLSKYTILDSNDTAEAKGLKAGKSYYVWTAMYGLSDSGDPIDGGTLTITTSSLEQGDANVDGNVDIVDVAFLVDVLTGKSTEIYNADVNEDGKVDTDDVKAVVNLILYGTITSPDSIDYGGSNIGDDKPHAGESKSGTLDNFDEE